MPDEPYMTVKQVAQLMQVEPQTVRRWVKLRRLNPLRVGQTIRFKRADLMTALEKYEYGDPNPPHDPSMG